MSLAQFWLLPVCVCCLLAPLTEGRDVCYKTDISAQLSTTAETQLITRTLHACSDLCRSVVQKHWQYAELGCLSCSPALLTNTNDRLVRINDHIIPELARQVTVSVLRFICVDLKILTALFGIFLQYQLNCYWLDHKTCPVESRNISHLVFSHMAPACCIKDFLLFLPWWQQQRHHTIEFWTNTFYYFPFNLLVLILSIVSLITF